MSSGLLDNPSRRPFWLFLILTLAASATLSQTHFIRLGKVFKASDNLHIAEAQSWWQGRLDVQTSDWDVAKIDGRAYSPFPPIFTALAAAAVPFWDGVPRWLMAFGLFAPLPILAYFLFYRRTGSFWWAAVLATSFVHGTSTWPVVERTLRAASTWMVNHVVSTLGLLLIFNEFFGRRRVWIAGTGLILSSLSRQLTFVYAPLVLFLAWHGKQAEDRRGRVSLAAIFILLPMLATLAFHTAKFGHPLDSGYLRIYEGRRDDPLAEAARTHGLFSLYFVPRNLYYAVVGPPNVRRVERQGDIDWDIRPNVWGTGILWTSPILLWLFADLVRIWRNPDERLLLICASLVFSMVMCFHTTGYAQTGFNRFSLDYLPAVFALIAPRVAVGRRWAVTLCMTAWSVLYFSFLI